MTGRPPRRLVVDGEVFQFLEVGGIARVHTELLPRLCTADPDLRIRLVTEGTLASRPPSHPRITHIPLPDSRRLLRPGRLWKGAVPKAAATLRRAAFGSGRGAIWHSTHYTSPTTWAGAKVVTVYDLIHERFPDRYDRPQDDRHRALKRAAVEGADAVIAISRYTADELADYFGPLVLDRTTVIPLAPAPVFSARSGRDERPPGRPYLLHVGRRARHKAFARLVDAFATWPGRADVDLVTIGPVWSPAEEQQIADLGVAGQVRRLAPMDDDRLAQQYRHAAALVHPAMTEGFGLPALEALACDCPVIARRLPVTLEVAGGHPLYVDWDDDEDVHAAFDHALGLLGRSDRTQGGAAHATGFTWTATAAATTAVYRELTA